MAAGGSEAAAVAFLAEHGFACKEVDVDGNLQMRVTALDVTALVVKGKIPVDKLRLVPEVVQLQYLELLRAEGQSLQLSECGPAVNDDAQWNHAAVCLCR